MPCYDGRVHMATAERLVQLTMLLCVQNISVELFSIHSESLIPRARNVCGCKLLNSGHTHMLFIDSDIVFDPKDICKMISLQRGVVCCAYPKKAYPLDFAIGDVHPGDGSTFCLTSHGATGLMLIHRCVLETMVVAYPAERYKNDLPQYSQYTVDGTLFNFFFAGVCDGRYYSEDYGFCMRAKDCGHSIHVLLGTVVTHIGSHEYTGRFPLKD